MKYLFYILSLLISASTIKAQSSAEMKISVIDKKLNEMPKNLASNSNREKVLLEIKKESETLKYTSGILQSIDYLMRLYSNQGKYKKAAEIGNGIKEIIPDNPTSKEKRVISNIFRTRASVVSNFGFLEEGLKDFKTAISYAKEIENNDQKFYNLSLCYENITLYYGIKHFENKKYRDSIIYYHKKSLEKAFQISDKSSIISQSLKYDQIAFNDIRMGIFYLEQVDTKGSLQSAEKYLLRALKIHENKTYQIPASNKIILLNQLSWLYMEKKDYKTSISYAKHALNLEKQYQDPYNRVESLEFLAYCYTEIGEKEQSAIYMGQYASLKDSLSMMEKNNTKEPLKQIVSDIDNTHKKNTKNQFILIVGIVFVAALATLFFWRRQNKRLHQKYNALITKLSHQEENIPLHENAEHKETKPASVITDDISRALLQKLEKFEKSEKYLRKDISLAWLAHHLDTNTKYLSEGIKKHRDTNFSDYINGLKINYIVNKLYENPVYRKYKISYLSEECGYATPHVFRSSFKKETGITPSYFIKELENEEIS
ncbi:MULTISPECIES: helix-turn-helix domain-containing protein [Chryseobacterium]|uniref:helix-turn-helix domain-containing protein n=1 Tax=Chryseobacterium TaxID=59732 RepID=UPI001297748C|nr:MULTISPECIES: helix-turn-helix domain-containing protein [Chryseobacterium]MDR6919872.1 AraC-like DNA-binding protein [Chryseobacterium sp. 2987]